MVSGNLYKILHTVKFAVTIYYRLNKTPPNIIFKKKEKGGINLQTMVPQSELDLDLVKTILAEYRISNADITLRYVACAVLFGFY